MDQKNWLPEELEAHAVGDERFAQAYEAAGDRQRSLLKSLIAALWHLHPPRRMRLEVHESGWEQGGGALLFSRPLSWTMLCVDASAASPGLVLSALLPALTAGVSEIAVIGIGPGALTPPVLTALELVGQERVFELQAHEAGILARNIASTHVGMLMCLGREAQAAFADARLATWSPKPSVDGRDCRSGFSLGIFLEEKQQFSNQLTLDINYLLPGVAVEWWSSSGKLGPSIAPCRAGDFPSFAENCFDAVLVPQHLCRLALETFPVVLGLDRAGHWLWRDLTDAHFRLRHSAMF